MLDKWFSGNGMKGFARESGGPPARRDKANDMVERGGRDVYKRQDLNIMLSQEKLPEEFRGDTADIGLRPYATEDGTPTEQNRPISSWNRCV